MYKQLNQLDVDGKVVGILDVILREDGAQIPFDPANTDYQAYLKWLDAGGVVLEADASAEEGNTPEPADTQG